MSKLNGSDSAMPYVVPGSVEDRYVEPGITIRQYFAAMAMQGLISSCSHALAIGSNLKSYPEIPKEAVQFADALISELNK